MMAHPSLAVGTEIYNSGDRANRSAFGVVMEIKTDRWGEHIRVRWDGFDLPDSWLETYYFSPVYLGHGGTRLVTKAAYMEWRRDQLLRLQASLAR